MHLCKDIYLTAAILTLLLPAKAISQTNPTELAGLSLEELLGINVYGENSLLEGNRWFLQYAYRSLKVGGYQHGTNRLGLDDVSFSPGSPRTASNYPVVPTEITQKIHAFSTGYRFSESFSVSVSVPMIEQHTDHLSIVPGFSEFKISTDGIGDIALNGSYILPSSGSQIYSVNVGVSLPTGSIDEVGDTPRNGPGTFERLPYTMQLGSGTYDLLLSTNFSNSGQVIDYGGSLNSTIRQGTNDNDYRLGNNFGLRGWARYRWNQRFQPGIAVSFRHTDDIQGMDLGLTVPGPFPFPASITDPDNFGGRKAKVGLNARICAQESCNLNFLFEINKPFYQDLNGIQVKEKTEIALSAKFSF